MANYDGDLQKYLDNTINEINEDNISKYLRAAKITDKTNSDVEAKLGEIAPHHRTHIDLQRELEQKVGEAILDAYRAMDETMSETEQEVQRITSIMSQLNQRVQTPLPTGSERDRLERLYNDF